MELSDALLKPGRPVATLLTEKYGWKRQIRVRRVGSVVRIMLGPASCSVRDMMNRGCFSWLDLVQQCHLPKNEVSWLPEFTEWLVFFYQYILYICFLNSSPFECLWNVKEKTLQIILSLQSSVQEVDVILMQLWKWHKCCKARFIKARVISKNISAISFSWKGRVCLSKISFQ